MSGGLNPLSFNDWVTTVGALAVELVESVSGVNQFVSPQLQAVLPQILSYAEGRIQRDLDLLNSQTSNTYTLTAGQQMFPIPLDDFFTIQTLEVVQPGGVGAPSCPLTETSKEFIQNVYGSSLSTAGIPKYYAKYGDDFNSDQDSNTNIYFGPAPGFGFTLKVTGTQRTPSLYTFASFGIADSNYTYISNYLPDMLTIASMIFISMYQRNWGGSSDDSPMGLSYEKQYQALRLGAIPEENRRKSQGSAWSNYSTPVSATATR